MASEGSANRSLYSEADIFKLEPSYDDEQAAPINFLKIYSYVLRSFNTYFAANSDDDSKKRIKYLDNLYYYCVFQGKKFKAGMVREGADFTSADVVEDDADKIFKQYIRDELKEQGIKNTTEFELYGSTWVFLSKGDPVSGFNPRSGLYDVDVNEAQPDGTSVEKTIVVPVLSHKLFQACITCMLVSFNQHKNRKPAPLCANIFAACLDPRNAPTANNWGIHGHSGLNFVAKFVYQLTHTLPKDVSEAEIKVFKGIVGFFPPVEACLMAAYRLDESNKTNPTYKKNSEENSKKGKVDPNPTVTSIFQTTGMSSVEASNYLKLIQIKHWGAGVVSAAAGMSASFVKGIKLLEKDPAAAGSSKPPGNSDNQNVFATMANFTL